MVRPISITIAGKTHPSKTEAAAAHGVSVGKLSRRLRYGWTPEQAAGIAPPPNREPNFRNPIEVEGRKFSSLKKAAEHYGIDPRTFVMRLSRGDSPERAAGVVERVPQGNPNPVELAGKLYPSIKDACAVHGVAPHTYGKRVKRGWTPEQAAGFEPPRPRSAKPKRSENIGGTEYPLAEAGEYLLYLITNSVNKKEYVGITTNGLALRFKGHISESIKRKPAYPLHRAMARYGADKFKIKLLRKDAKNYVELMEQEIEEIARRDTWGKGYNATFGGEIPANAIRTEAEGKTYPTLTSAAIAYGLDPRVVHLRVKRLGWRIEDALELNGSIAEKKQVTAGGVVYSSLRQAAEELGKPYKTVHARASKRGWTVEQALGIDPYPEYVKNKPRRVVIDGMEFASQAAAARHFGMSPSLVTRRMKKLGMTLEQALKTPKAK